MEKWQVHNQCVRHEPPLPAFKPETQKLRPQSSTDDPLKQRERTPSTPSAPDGAPVRPTTRLVCDEYVVAPGGRQREQMQAQGLQRADDAEGLSLLMCRGVRGGGEGNAGEKKKASAENARPGILGGQTGVVSYDGRLRTMAYLAELQIKEGGMAGAKGEGKPPRNLQHIRHHIISDLRLSGQIIAGNVNVCRTTG